MESYNQLFRYIDSLYSVDEPLSAPLTTSDPVAVVQPRDFVEAAFDDLIEIRTSRREGESCYYPKRAVVFNPVTHKIQAWEIETWKDIEDFNNFYSGLVYDQILLYSDRYHVVIPVTIHFRVTDAPLCSVVGNFNGILVHLGFAHAHNSDQLQQQLRHWFVPVQTYLVGVNNIVRVSPRPVTTNHDMHALNGNIRPRTVQEFRDIKPQSSWSNTELASGIYSMTIREFRDIVFSAKCKYLTEGRYHPTLPCDFVCKMDGTHAKVFMYQMTKTEYDAKWLENHPEPKPKTDKAQPAPKMRVSRELHDKVVKCMNENRGEKEREVTKASQNDIEAYQLFHSDPAELPALSLKPVDTLERPATCSQVVLAEALSGLDHLPLPPPSRTTSPHLSPEFEEICAVPHVDCNCSRCWEACQQCECVKCKKLCTPHEHSALSHADGGIQFVPNDQLTQSANPTVPEHTKGKTDFSPVLVRPNILNPRLVEYNKPKPAAVSLSQLEIETDLNSRPVAAGIQSAPVVVSMKPVSEKIDLVSVPLEVSSQPTVTSPVVDIEKPVQVDTLSFEGVKLPIIADMGDGVAPDFAASFTLERVFKNFTEIELTWRWYWYPLLLLIPALCFYVVSHNVDEYLMPRILSYFIGLVSITLFIARSLSNYLAARRKTPSWFTLHKLGPLSTFVGFTKDAKSSDLPHNLYEITSYRQMGQVYRKIVQYVPVCELLVNEIMSQATLFDSYDSIDAFVETRIASVGCRVKNLNVPSTAIVNGWGQKLEMTTLQTTKLIVKASLYLTLQTSIEQGFCLGSSA